MITIRMATAAAVMTLVLAAGASDPAAARNDRAPAPVSAPQTLNDGEAYHRADDAEQDPAELRMTQALNDEIAQRNQLAENQERADRAAFEAERADFERGVAETTQARLAYEEALRRAEAAQRQWQADVRACEAGDRTRCSTPRPM